MKYRKKPLEIEAWQFMGPSHDMPDWIRVEWLHCEVYLDVRGHQRSGSPLLCIPTREGTMEARIGDWIIKGVEGEIYPCKPGIFEKTYDRVPESEPDAHQ